MYNKKCNELFKNPLLLTSEPSEVIDLAGHVTRLHVVHANINGKTGEIALQSQHSSSPMDATKLIIDYGKHAAW